MGAERAHSRDEPADHSVSRPDRTEASTPARHRTNLVVGAVDDPAEREAEAIATRIDALLQQPPSDAASGAALPVSVGSVRLLPIRRAIDDREARPSQPIGPEGGAVDGELAGRIHAASGGGRPLDRPIMQRMETAFGTSFADVRIHANSAAAPALGARAFTLGTDVHFAPGEYRPNAKAGMHVLGHELAHVVQQHGTNHASATRLTRRSGAGRGVVRRLVAPAYVDETAGMHKYDVVAGNSHLVKKGGMTRSGILGDIPAGTRVMFDLDRQSPNYLLVTYNGQSGYVNRTHLTVAERIAGSDFYALEDKANKWVHFYDVSTGTYFDDAMPTGFKDEVIANLTVMLNALAAAEKATKLSVDKRRNVVKHVLHQYALGSPVDPGLWPLAAANLAVVKQRVANDLADLERAGLITVTCVLQSVEFTGADFHKHGQAPLFLTFYDVLSKQPVRIVYKPGDLSVDRAVFGKSGAGGAKGVAETMDPTGNYASVYTILPREDAVHQKYGFMQFVETGLPQTALDLEGVYRSLAVNMAVSYLVGLEDVHHENVLLLTNRVQVIDMEATTGAFNMDPNDLTTGGFGAMLWWKAINDGIKPKLKKAVDAGTLTAAPTTATVRAAMTTEFRKALGRAANRGKAVGAQADALAQQRARLVPIKTEDFYHLIDPAKNAGSLPAWRTKVDTDDEMVNGARGETGHTVAFVKRVLRSQATYESLLRGEVPYFSRDLGSTDVFDERGIPIDSTGCAKVSGPIDTAMKGRREDLRDEGFKAPGQDVSNTNIMKMFNVQILDALIAPLNDELLGLLA